MANYAAVVAQIAIINLVFSIDSIVTAVGMANEIWIMAVAVILSMMVLMFASGPVATFVEAHPTVKILALGFLIMIGMALVADTFGAHVPKGYIYTAMVFSVFIELINMKQRRKAKPIHLRNPYGEETETGGDERQALEQAGMPGAGARPSRICPGRSHSAASPASQDLNRQASVRPCASPARSVMLVPAVKGRAATSTHARSASPRDRDSYARAVVPTHCRKDHLTGKNVDT